jgi:hypothetical protein
MYAYMTKWIIKFLKVFLKEYFLKNRKCIAVESALSKILQKITQADKMILGKFNWIRHRNESHGNDKYESNF